MSYESDNQRFSRRKILKWGSAAIVGGFIGEALIEPNRIESVRISVSIKDLPKSLEGFKLGVLSDIHWGHAIDAIYMKKACDAVMAFKPDLLVIPGDFLHGSTRPGWKLPSFDGVLDSLDAPFGIVGVLGNHDHWAGKNFSMDQVHTHTKVQLLDNKGITIEGKDGILAIGGVGDLWEDEIDFKKAFKGVSPDTPRILLSHNPDVAEYVQSDKETRVDLQISGHTHGGQFVLPGVYDPTSRVSKYGSKFNHGLVQGNRHRVFVSKGVGRPHGMRLFAPPDVACLTLTCA